MLQMGKGFSDIYHTPLGKEMVRLWLIFSLSSGKAAFQLRAWALGGGRVFRPWKTRAEEWEITMHSGKRRGNRERRKSRVRRNQARAGTQQSLTDTSHHAGTTEMPEGGFLFYVAIMLKWIIFHFIFKLWPCNLKRFFFFIRVRVVPQWYSTRLAYVWCLVPPATQALQWKQIKQNGRVLFILFLDCVIWGKMTVPASLPWMEMLVAGLGGGLPGRPLLVMGRELGSAPLLCYSSGKMGRIVVEGLTV